jgi:hypothetical protein
MNKDSLDHIKARMEMSHEIFGDRLKHFVRKWRPEYPADTYEFQTDLTRLMVDAMCHKSETLSYGLELYASMQFNEMAMAPIHMIFKAGEKP